MTTKPKSSIANKKIIDLKKKILESIFTGQSMPNVNMNLSFPDLQFFLGQQNQYLVDDEVTGHLFIPQNNKNLEIIPSANLNKLTILQEKTVFFQFDIIEKSAENLKIKLELKIIGLDVKNAITMSTILLNFKKSKADWILLEDPISLSA